MRAAGNLPVVRTVIIPGGGLARESVILVAVPVLTALPPAGDPKVTATIVTDKDANAPAPAGWGARKEAALGLGIVAVAGLGGRNRVYLCS